jgi:penicillin-binding protein 1A
LHYNINISISKLYPVDRFDAVRRTHRSDKKSQSMFKSMLSFFKQQAHTPNTDTFNNGSTAPKTLGYWFKRALLIGAVLVTLIVLFLGISMALIYPKLPSMESVTDYRPKIPLRIYTADNALIAEFGEERRTFVNIADVPKHMKQAILATEDDRFYEHSGIDYIGITRATLSNLTGGTGGGASTITQQVARNFFLTSNEPSVFQKMRRKIYEILLSFKLEEQLSKDKILELYVNQIFLGQRAYGFAAASRVYFGVALKDISIEQAAMLAGIPKFPGSANPVANFNRAKSRQNYILERMLKLGYITKAQHDKARANPMTDIRQSTDSSEVRADYVAEMVRKIVHDKYGDDVYSMGLTVYTTILKDDQTAAYEALRTGLLNYDKRHGYRGPEGFLKLPAAGDERDEAIEEALQKHPNNDQLVAAVVTIIQAKKLSAVLGSGEMIDIAPDGLKLIASSLSDKSAEGKRVVEGSIIRVMKERKKDGTEGWTVIQIPDVEAAHIAINPQNGSVRALVGGFDFNKNKFNHVIQGWRQPGSSFKPFIYSAALERGYTPETIVEDEPFTVDAALTGGKAWEPKNYDGKFEGPMPLRTALAKSKNMVSIRLMQAVGGSTAQEWVTRFGFEADKHPPYLTMALGAGSTNPWQMSEAYAVFANGGYKINTFLINKVVDGKGKVLMQAKPKLAGEQDYQVISTRNANTMHSMMQDVVRYGTATKANVLKRNDLAGKTGTTNDSHDAWFAGYSSQVVGITWAGFDQPKSLGDKETGGGVALPIWIDYMAKVLPKLPELPRKAAVETPATEGAADAAPISAAPALAMPKPNVSSSPQ